MARTTPWYPGRRSWAPWRGRGRGWEVGTWLQELPVNIYDSAETWIVTAPVPGMEPGDVDLKCEGNAIIIEAPPKGFPQLPKDYLVHEWHPGPYYRRIELPREVEARACEASVAAGMLVVRIPKPEWEKAVHIPVRAAGQEVEGHAREAAPAQEPEVAGAQAEHR